MNRNSNSRQRNAQPLSHSSSYGYYIDDPNSHIYEHVYNQGNIIRPNWKNLNRMPHSGSDNDSREHSHRQKHTRNPLTARDESFMSRDESFRTRDDSPRRSYSDFEGAHYVGRTVRDDEDYLTRQRRTTAIHRNVSGRQPGVNPKALEARRGWVASASDNTATTSLEQHASNIVYRMEQDETLMEDSPESEQLRKEALRDMPQCLTVKRHIKSKLLHSVSRKSKHKPVGFFKRMKYRMSIRISQMKASIKNLAYTFELWYSSLKTIEGHFGSGVATYFKFLRWLFIINSIVAVLALSFIVLPQILYENLQAKNQSNSEEFHVKDIITGEGYFTDTIVYFGHYTNQTPEIITGLPYSIPYAYFFTMVVLYFTYFVILSVSMARSYRRNFIETEGGLKNVFALKVFCGWDYSIATQEAAKLKSSSLYLELKELLSDMDGQSIKKTFCSKFVTWTLQITAHVIVVLLFGGTAYLMWSLLETHRSNLSTDTDSVSIITAAVVNAVMLVFPLFLSLLVKYEDYKNPKIALYITLFRTFLLEVIVVGVLITFWLTHSEEDLCWETSLGQEIYRLIVFDFVFSVVLAAFLGLLRFVVHKYIWAGIGAEEFDIARHTLNIIYNQTLFWVGFLFSPVLSVIVVVKLWCIWYIRRTSVLMLCKPSTKSWRAAQTQTWFLIMTFFSLLLAFGINGYILVGVSSAACGPFNNYGFIYEIIINGVLQLEKNSMFWKVLMYFTRPGVIALILIALCVPVYYLRAKAHAQRGMVKILREMLAWEARDKEFLLQHISKVTKGQWQYNLQESRGAVMDLSHVAPELSPQMDERRFHEEEDYGDGARSLFNNETFNRQQERDPADELHMRFEMSSRSPHQFSEQPHSSHENINADPRQIPVEVYMRYEVCKADPQRSPAPEHSAFRNSEAYDYQREPYKKFH